VGVQSADDGSRRVVRLELTASGRRVTAATILDASIPATEEPTFVTLSGNSLAYLTQSNGSAASNAEFVIRRIPLR
jgi:hypothetical protein